MFRQAWGKTYGWFKTILLKPFKRIVKTLNNWVNSEQVLQRVLRVEIGQQQENETFSFVSIGTIHSIYKDKFGTPRQGSLVPTGRGSLVLEKQNVDPLWSLYALEEFSHVWLIFVFHSNTNLTGKPTPKSKVRPPQGAGKKIGVFATRSPHRPNPIGLTLARLRKVDKDKGIVFLEGLDLCEGTPILDIKPYCEHVDWPGLNVALTPNWVVNPKFDRAQVNFSEEAMESLRRLVDDIGYCEWYAKGEFEIAKQAIVDIISLDPRDLNRGRGAFSTTVTDDSINDMSSGKFERRENKIRQKAVTRPVFCRFDNLDITFRPDDEARAFNVISIEPYQERNKTQVSVE